VGSFCGVQGPETVSEKRDKLLGRCAALVAAAMVEPDETRSAELIDRSADAFIAAVDAAWGERIAAGQALLGEAERLLDRAEATRNEGEQKGLLQLFELCMSAARIGVVPTFVGA
jgi:hypothetical protein